MSDAPTAPEYQPPSVTDLGRLEDLTRGTDTQGGKETGAMKKT
jgi:hypothetical protein